SRGLMRAATGAAWLTARGAVPLDRPRVVGILNVTPDSFWDGGLHAGVEAAVVHADQLLADGADILDVGGESTRPGARPVPPGEERARVVPVVRAIVRAFPDALVSIDTVKAEVADAALAEGAAIVNDVSGLRLDPAMPEVVRRAGAGIILMHSRGGVETMARYAEATYGADPVGEVTAELAAALERARAAGIAEAAIVLDPGLGFSKRTEHSIAMLAHLDRIVALGRPVLVGPSRKRFVGEVAGGLAPQDRLPGTLAACAVALLRGARLFRVHDVLEACRALAVAEAVWNAS
ncbi:MAG TPA: dihydropteroate synthase, partial [Longimicrobiales bacterium]|nr:dihydropteroate synthase [Longimicrobiales bacterium]